LFPIIGYIDLWTPRRLWRGLQELITAVRLKLHITLVILNDDAYGMIKWKQVYDYLEEATDRCEDVGDVLQGVILKNA